jgi:hypothetical protein
MFCIFVGCVSSPGKQRCVAERLLVGVPLLNMVREIDIVRGHRAVLRHRQIAVEDAQLTADRKRHAPEDEIEGRRAARRRILSVE